MNAHKPQIIVNADDFGLHPAVNEAVERGHRDGIITSTSLMTLGDSVDDGVRRAHSLPSLDIGLHFCMAGVPGFPSSFSQFFSAALRGQFPARRIERELKCQLDLALRTYGLPISHIDSHQHLHALPSVMRVVCRVAAEYDIPGIRVPLDGPPFASVTLARKAQTAALRAACRLSRRYIAYYGRRTTDHFSGMAVSGHTSSETLCEYLDQALPGTTEIVCHPGTDNRALTSLYDWQYNWEKELSTLCAPSVRNAAQSVSLMPWTDL